MALIKNTEMVIDNWAAVLLKSLSLWFIYIGLVAGAIHETITQVPHGIIPDALIAKADGVCVAVAFVSIVLAIPARVVKQVSLAQKPTP